MNYAISTSYGNDSTAMIQWAAERGLQNVTVVYCDTGWAAPGWDERVTMGEQLAKRHGFDTAVKEFGMYAESRSICLMPFFDNGTSIDPL